ncbi:hypothetical protein ANO14919_002640 [Xylariales sp. No.14919]|nr:hypothetical protein ANO14919_002640 [Xylariales sp. No.14919]
MRIHRNPKRYSIRDIFSNAARRVIKGFSQLVITSKTVRYPFSIGPQSRGWVDDLQPNVLCSKELVILTMLHDEWHRLSQAGRTAINVRAAHPTVRVFPSFVARDAISELCGFDTLMVTEDNPVPSYLANWLLGEQTEQSWEEGKTSVTEICHHKARPGRTSYSQRL